MKIAVGLLLSTLSLAAFAQEPTTISASAPIDGSAQEQACGGEGLRAMDTAPPQQDPAMQAKMDRLRASMRKRFESCMNTLQRAQDRDQSLGISVVPSKVAQGRGVQLLSSRVLPPDPSDTVGVCSVVASNGKPCVQKVSERRGAAGQPDEVVFGNSCINPIEISVLYQDGSRGLATVKPAKTASLFCNECGGVKSTEAVCR